MKLSELKNIHSWVRHTAVSEIVFVSALILPLYLMMYDFAAERISPGLKSWALGFALVIYVVGVVWMKMSQSRDERDQKDLALIINHIIDQNFTFMGFEQIKEIDKKYTEERVRELMFNFPNHIRLGKLSGGKRGIKILNVENEDT